MTVEPGSINSTPKITDATSSNGIASKGGDNLDEFRLPGKTAAAATEPIAKESKPNSGEGIFTAAASGAALGMASPIYGTAMRDGAQTALEYQLGKGGFFTGAGEWLNSAVIHNKLGVKANPFALLGEAAQDQLGLRTQLELLHADSAIGGGLMRTAMNGAWIPESNMLKAAGKGGAAGLSDWAVDRGLEWATGAHSLRPNVIETSLVAGAMMSPIPGRYKVAAVAAGWGIGKLSNIIGLT
jgi:hypothetical protein